MRSAFLRSCLLLGALAAAAPALASPAASRVVAGQRLPVLTAEPAFDEGTFFAAAGTELAARYQAQLLSPALDEFERTTLKVDALPDAGLFLVRVQRDRKGKLYLYRPCDGGYHRRQLITDTHVWMLGGEPLMVPLTRTQRRGRLTTLELDTQGLPPMIATRIQLRTSARAGLYEELAEDGTVDGLLMTPAAARKLSVIVRVCKKAKVQEFDFSAR